jgi:hypothetical protein
VPVPVPVCVPTIVFVCLCLHLRVRVGVAAQIHWFSIFNSFMMVLFLVGLVALILLRTLSRDFARYEQVDMPAEVEWCPTGNPPALAHQA